MGKRNKDKTKKGKIQKALEEPALDLMEELLGDGLLDEKAQQAKVLKDEYWDRMYSLGRRPAYEKVEDLFTDAMDYVVHCAAAYQMPNKAGLAVWLKMGASTLARYATMPEFREAIKEIHGLIEDRWVQRLRDPHAVGAIFYLKNAFKSKYRDSYNADHTSGGKPIQYTIPKEIAEKHSLVILDPAAPPQPINADAVAHETEGSGQ